MDNLLGRWDLIVGGVDDNYPSWVELTAEGGRFVGQVGSARPLGSVEINGDEIRFQLPKQYEGRTDDLIFVGHLEDGKLVGTTTFSDGTATTWQGVRAPDLADQGLVWTREIDMLARGMDAWQPRDADAPFYWSFEDEGLVNSAVGTDIVSKEVFGDFELESEYAYPAKSNSGIYLRGRYEFQILDDFEQKPNTVGSTGAVYGFLTPSENAVLAPDEWNSVKITLRGRWITVVLNGTTIHENVEIPGITGGALDSNEAAPGPIFLQGDHGPITFRKLVIRTA